MPPSVSANSSHCRAQIQPIAELQVANTLQQQQQRRGVVSETNTLYDSLEDRVSAEGSRNLLHETADPVTNSQIYSRSFQDSRYDLYDRTRPESVYSRPSNEQIYDRISDPIYERVRVSETPHISNEHHHHQQQQYQSSSLLRYPMSHAEPQVPIYRPIKRMVARRASEGSGCSSIGDATNDSETASYGSIDVMRSSEPGSSRLSIDSRRDSSPASKDSASSPYDSNSTLTGNECSGEDSVIMNRLRKSFEQKAEFLRRPSYPIGLFVSGNDASEPPLSPLSRSGGLNQAVIQREFYARPQKLQRPIWPPGNEQQRQQSPTRRQASQEGRNIVAKPAGILALSKPSNQSVQRIKEIDSDSEYWKSRNDRSDPQLAVAGENKPATGDHSYSTSHLYNDDLAKEIYLASNKSPEQQQYRGASKNSFISTLSRIHENVTAMTGIGANQQQSQDAARNGSSSLPSSPGPDKKVGDAKTFPVPPQGLQIVSRRAKQFESGCLLSDEDEPAGDRTNLYKSELSRLSNKKSVPNVAVRKREFESKAESQEPRRLPTRETKSLDTGKFDRYTIRSLFRPFLSRL